MMPKTDQSDTFCLNVLFYHVTMDAKSVFTSGDRAEIEYATKWLILYILEVIHYS